MEKKNLLIRNECALNSFWSDSLVSLKWVGCLMSPHLLRRCLILTARTQDIVYFCSETPWAQKGWLALRYSERFGYSSNYNQSPAVQSITHKQFSCLLSDSAFLKLVLVCISWISLSIPRLPGIVSFIKHKHPCSPYAFSWLQAKSIYF